MSDERFSSHAVYKRPQPVWISRKAPMFTSILLAFDLAIAISALASGWLWWLASRQRIRRISRHEELDAADLNRIVTALNRTQILNSRAALTTAAAAVFAVIRLLLNYLA